MRRLVLSITLAAAALWPALAVAQAPAAQAPPQAARDPLLDPDRPFRPLQPDFTIINLPTTLRMPLYKSSFRVTQGDTSPVAISASAAIDGSDNFTEEFSPSIGFIVSREITNVGAVYVQPYWVGNVNIFEPVITADDNTILFALGGRFRIRPTVYLVGEFIPRLTGYDLGVSHGTFGIEKRSGGHSFQLNFSNGLGSTMSQLARGGTGGEDWYLGFNISRKFF
jgi:hypothetical protein